MFTSAEYRTAADVLAAEPGEDRPVKYVRYLRARADRAAGHEKFARRLGLVGHTGEDALSRGTRLIRLLIDDGWTPPPGAPIPGTV